jgi:ABC-type Na+ efflux pump permease subunit
MGYVLFEMGPALLNPGSSRTRFSGTPAKARMVLAIFGAVLTFGLTALGYGLWQMFTGRRSKRVIYFAVALAGLLVLLAYVL